ncbi:MAG: adenylate/guanylate cyclase domain-containing protein [Dongiaceae bacterium]
MGRSPQAVTAPPAPVIDCADPLVDWLLTEAPALPSTDVLIGELGARLNKAGLPVARIQVGTRTLHPQLFAIGFLWYRGQAAAQEIQRGHEISTSAIYLDSPVKAIHDGAPEIRRRLEGPDAVLDFPVMVDLQKEGMTDVLLLPLRSTGKRPNSFSVSTNRPGGFTERDVTIIRRLMPVLSLVLDIKQTKRMAGMLLEVYLGRNAGRRVLEGRVKRGDVDSIAAALWYCDLRSFTAITEGMSPQDVVLLLNDYFDCMSGPVHRHEGEVLKFIGDGFLAIFPIRDDLDRDRACNTALKAAQESLAALKELNASRQTAGKQPLEVGIALHIGSVMYGNVGAAERLDFTITGPAVNLVSRIENLCRDLHYPLLTSAQFASPCGSTLRSIGLHRLRGVAAPQEIYTLPELAERQLDAVNA